MDVLVSDGSTRPGTNLRKIPLANSPCHAIWQAILLGAFNDVAALLGVCCVCLSLASLGSAESTANPLLVPGNPLCRRRLLPEHWPEERWETDLRMMHEAGFNVVRVAEFSWVLFEPSEGEFEFDWLDRWLELAEKYDIKVIVGTPTAIMPAWLAKKYPEALSQKADGTRTVWGGRRHNCFSDEDYRRLSERSRPQNGRALRRPPARHRLADRQRIRQQRLPLRQVPRRLSGVAQDKYGDLDELNRAWGTHFWGQRFARLGRDSHSRRSASATGRSAIPARRSIGSGSCPTERRVSRPTR